MIRFLADENLSFHIVRGARRLDERLDIVRVQDVGLTGADDPTVLEWAAAHARILLTHDVATMTAYAYRRVREGKLMPGVIEISRSIPIQLAIRDIHLIATCSLEGEWEGQVLYLPLG